MMLKQFLLCFSFTLLLNHPVFAQDRCTENKIKKNIEQFEQEAVVNCGLKSFKPLTDIIKKSNGNTEIRKNAIYFLGEIKGGTKEELEKVVNLLIDILKQKNYPLELRLETVSTLATIGQNSQSLTLKIVNALIDTFNQSNEEKPLRIAAFANLKIIAVDIENNLINQKKEQFSSDEVSKLITAFDKAIKIGKENSSLFGKTQIDTLSSSLFTLKQKQQSRWQVRIINWIGKGWLIQIGFWVVLIFIYPNSSQVQAIFFWNPKVRKILGLWYVDLALTWIPFLRYKLFIPFKDSLVSDAHLDTFDAHTYFANSDVKLQDSTDIKSIREAIPEIKEQVILEGESGLGKSMFLRHLVKSSQRIVVYLPAQKCAQGVIEAIKDKLHGHVKEDPNFLESLIYSGAIDICIDGLNEVTPDTRANITGFVERYFKGNIILATQPLEWTPPSNAQTYIIQPLNQDQIEQFLVSRQEILPSDASVKGSDYEQACKDYLTTILSQQQSEEEQKAVRWMLSNPMELTLVALMIARREKPNLLNLQQQQYEIMAEDYDRLYLTNIFPLKAFSETVYQMRLKDESAIPPEEWLEELQCMERHKMVISRQLIDFEGKPTKKWNFRHDKIQEFFIMQTFLGEQKDNRVTGHISDPRFRGVYFLLATTMPIDDANNLREMLIQYAANTKDHTVSDTFIQLVRSRQPSE
jgi:hypothetical protein